MGDTIHIRNARILTLSGGGRLRKGIQMGDLGVIPHGEIVFAKGVIKAVGTKLEVAKNTETIDAKGRVLMPGFVDCHTHACWAGNRLAEWELKLKGVPYLEILKNGGGIHATVCAVHEATQKQLTAYLLDRLNRMLLEGTTTVEVKSGYGLTTESELKMLRATVRASLDWSGTVVPTALLGHAVEGSLDFYSRMVVGEMLPEVSREFPNVVLDAYVEEGAWTRDACVKLFEEAKKCHPLRVHADQFHSLGMVSEAIRLRARSIDHLEASTAADLTALAGSSTCGVVLPCTGFHTDGRYAKAGFIVKKGGSVALATNCNPGTAPTHSMPLAIALAVRFCGLSPAQAIVACTVNAAVVLGLLDRGTIEPGMRADLILLRHTDERMLAYEFGGNPVDWVICGGKRMT